jgi:hypothetical protein
MNQNLCGWNDGLAQAGADTVGICSGAVNCGDCYDTTTSCNEGTEIPFRLELQTDNYPSETSWKVVDLNTNAIVAERGSYPDKNTKYHESHCLETQACVEFTIQDSFGDGLSSSCSCDDCVEDSVEESEVEDEGRCDGYYNIFYGDELIFGSNFDSDKTTIIGNCQLSS